MTFLDAMMHELIRAPLIDLPLLSMTTVMMRSSGHVNNGGKYCTFSSQVKQEKASDINRKWGLCIEIGTEQV